MARPCFSEYECEIIRRQVARRACFRQEFLTKRTDPCMHAKEAGYVFDPAIQRFASMKCTQLDHFRANPRTIFIGIATIIIPMFSYGYLIYKQRSEREAAIRAGKLKYRDRLFKFL